MAWILQRFTISGNQQKDLLLPQNSKVKKVDENA